MTWNLHFQVACRHHTVNRALEIIFNPIENNYLPLHWVEIHLPLPAPRYPRLLVHRLVFQVVDDQQFHFLSVPFPTFNFSNLQWTKNRGQLKYRCTPKEFFCRQFTVLFFFQNLTREKEEEAQTKRRRQSNSAVNKWSLILPHITSKREENKRV